MGVGEDESLEESISVTIIATGFNVDQQDEISNTEVKKVIHSLEDDQNEQDLSKDRDPAIIRPDIILEKKDEKIVHSLDVDDEEQNTLPEMDLIPTTELLRNMKVVYDEVLADVSDDEEDFVINEVKPTVDEPKDEVQDEEQIMLTFDLPLSKPVSIEKKTDKEEKKVMFSLDENEEVKDIPVKDYVELITVTEANEKGEKRYALDDYITMESSMNETKKQKDVLVKADEDIVFEKKVTEKKETTTEAEELDPMNSPISEILKERADERRKKMKEFNYKFNNSKIDDIEKVPAYKRQGVNLEQAQHSSENNASRLSLGADDNDDIQLRSNNSFLHDNVD